MGIDEQQVHGVRSEVEHSESHGLKLSGGPLTAQHRIDFGEVVGATT
jgi:hypothetical protein